MARRGCDVVSPLMAVLLGLQLQSALTQSPWDRGTGAAPHTHLPGYPLRGPGRRGCWNAPGILQHILARRKNAIKCNLS